MSVYISWSFWKYKSFLNKAPPLKVFQAYAVSWFALKIYRKSYHFYSKWVCKDQYFHVFVVVSHSVLISASVNPVVMGDDTVFRCLAVGGNPRTVLAYDWYGPDGKYIKPKTGSTSPGMVDSSHGLTLINVTYRDAGNYSCFVTNAGGTAFDVKLLNVLCE